MFYYIFLDLITKCIKLLMRIVKKIYNKIFGGLNTEERSVLQTLKKRPQAPYDFFSRYEKILYNSLQWEEINFKNNYVMELGCGPHLGFGPLAIYLGAKKFLAVDPTVNKNVFDSEKLINNYFRMTFKDFNGIFRRNITFSEFMSQLKSKTIFFSNTKNTLFDFNSKIDIQLSNSCLEHIENLNDALLDLKKLISPNGKYIHAVDFGSHMKSKNPFSNIYNTSPQQFKIRYGSKINLIPPSKMINMFLQSGFSQAKLVSYYYHKENFDSNIDKYWKENLEKDDFFLKVGIIAGQIN